MAIPFCYSRRVEFRDTDAAGIVHFSVFFNYMEEAEHALLRDADLAVVMSDDEGTYSFPRVAAQCDYRRPLRFDDVVTVAVSVKKIGDSSVTYGFTFKLDNEDVATGQVTTVCCRMPSDKHPQSIPVPTAIRDSLSKYAP